MLGFPPLLSWIGLLLRNQGGLRVEGTAKSEQAPRSRA